jgi:hypothetical protein
MPIVKHIAALTTVIVVLFAPAVRAQDRVIGLLTLPEVFGGEACTPFEPRPVPLYAEPGSTREVASIRVDQYWSFAPHGGCEGLEVSVHRGTATAELPTREYAYEAPAAIAVDERNGWFKIRLGEGTAWVAPAKHHQFLPLSELFDQALTAITNQFTGRLRREPGGELVGEQWTQYRDIRVLEVRRVGDRQWLHVEVMSHNICDANINVEPKAIAQGWMPAHSDTGEPTVWFSARGC